jgi:pyrimidine-specific ribonucleoside hydrolase
MQNAMNLLMLVGDPDIPVACGRETPLQGDHVFPQMWRDGVDSMAGLSLPENPNTPLEINAVELLTEIIGGADEPITLLTLGPMTNIAELLQESPELTENIAMIYVMGGAFEVSGNLYGMEGGRNRTAEWNIYVDPLALDIVLASGVPVTFIPLDATNDAPNNMDFYERLGADQTTPQAEFVYDVLTTQLDFLQSGGMYFWDPLAAAVATDESVVTLREETVNVITDEGSESGRTIISETGMPVRIAFEANAEEFELMLLDALNGRSGS